MNLWPDIERGKQYVGNGGGIRGARCTALRQTESGFGHKHAYVIWTDEVPHGVEVDQNGGSMVRTNLLDLVEEDVTSGN